MAQTEEFMFQNVVYWPTVYRTGGWYNQIQVFLHKIGARLLGKLTICITTPLLISPCLFGPFFRPKLGLMNMVMLLRNDRYMSHCTKAVEQAHYALYAPQTPDSKPCANFVLFAFHLCTRIWLRTLRLILSIKSTVSLTHIVSPESS